jgi:hypothetical protein
LHKDDGFSDEWEWAWLKIYAIYILPPSFFLSSTMWFLVFLLPASTSSLFWLLFSIYGLHWLIYFFLQFISCKFSLNLCLWLSISTHIQIFILRDLGIEDFFYSVALSLKISITAWKDEAHTPYVDPQ